MRLLLIVGERDGNPGSLDFYSVENAEDSVFSFVIDGVRLAREYEASVRSRTKWLKLSSDSNEESVTLRSLLEGYFEAETLYESNALRAGIRTLSISHLKAGRLRLTFKDSGNRRELGPSMTGRLSK